MGLGNACGCTSASGWMAGPGRRISGRILPTGSCGVGFFTRGLVDVRDCQTLVIGLTALDSGSVTGVVTVATAGLEVAGSAMDADAVGFGRFEGTEELRVRLSTSATSDGGGGVATLDTGVTLAASVALPVLAALADLFLFFLALPALGLKIRVSSLTVDDVGGGVGEGSGDRLGADALVAITSTVAGSAVVAELDEVNEADEVNGVDGADEVDEVDEADETEVSGCLDFLTFFFPLPVLVESAAGRVGTAGAGAGAEAGAEASSLATALRSRRTPALEAEYSV